MLTREVLRMRGTISRDHPWEVMPDLYFYRDPEEVRAIRVHVVVFVPPGEGRGARFSFPPPPPPTRLKRGAEVGVRVSEVCQSNTAGFSLTPRGLRSHEWGLIELRATGRTCRLEFSSIAVGAGRVFGLGGI
ncbi:UNVERIFIED_CONTAM: hypothetical protein FKN15_070358 [Acipenser sinensis]